MKKRWYWLILPLMLALLTLSASAEGSLFTADEQLPAEYTDFLEKFPEDLRSLLPDGLLSTAPAEVGAGSAELGDFSYLLKTTLTLVGLRLEPCVKILARVIGVLLLSAIGKALQSTLRSEGLARAFSYCTSLVMLLLLLGESYHSIRTVTDYLANLQSVTSASIPLMGALYAMGGNASAAVASSTGLSLFLVVLENIVSKSILPFCGICLAFSLVSSLDTSVRLRTLSDTVKRNYTTVLAFLMMLLLAMLGAQTTLGAKSDTLAMKSVKFAAGSMIPVVGGSVSELLRTVSASVGYMRGGVGICGVLLLILLLLPVLIELWLMRLVWQIAASVADLLGCDAEKRLLDEFTSLHGYLIAAVAICTAVPLFSFTLFLHCASAIG
ncbi:MAG: hypothetical protein IJW29_04465 [Clostridia bacterium]|nr:hypothetical protein [Clostridia bacterium]